MTDDEPLPQEGKETCSWVLEEIYIARKMDLRIINKRELGRKWSFNKKIKESGIKAQNKKERC